LRWRSSGNVWIVKYHISDAVFIGYLLLQDVLGIFHNENSLRSQFGKTKDMAPKSRVIMSGV